MTHIDDNLLVMSKINKDSIFRDERHLYINGNSVSIKELSLMLVDYDTDIYATKIFREPYSSVMRHLVSNGVLTLMGIDIPFEGTIETEYYITNSDASISVEFEDWVEQLS